MEQAQREDSSVSKSSNPADRITAALQAVAVSLMKIDRYE